MSAREAAALSPRPARSLTIGVLTGQRPELLSRTLKSFATNQRDVWEAATRVVVHNSADSATAAVLDGYEWTARVELEHRLRGIAEASAILIAVAADFDDEFFLRLEDDWEATQTPFLEDAIELLNRCAQVRLRRADEPVMTKHRVTKEPIVWDALPSGHLLSRSAHFTHNPNLMRLWDAVALGGYEDELDAARRFHEAGWASAQHEPGVFKHIGGGKHDGLSLKWTKGSA